MREPGPDLSATEDSDAPSVLGTLLVLIVAMVWLLMAVASAGMVVLALFFSALVDGWFPPLRVGPTLLLVSVSVTGFGIAWLLTQVRNRRTLSISLVAAAVLLGLTVALQLDRQGSITAGPDLMFAIALVLASGLAVWQTR